VYNFNTAQTEIFTPFFVSKKKLSVRKEEVISKYWSGGVAHRFDQQSSYNTLFLREETTRFCFLSSKSIVYFHYSFNKVRDAFFEKPNFVYIGKEKFRVELHYNEKIGVFHLRPSMQMAQVYISISSEAAPFAVKKQDTSCFKEILLKIQRLHQKSCIIS